MDLEVLLQSPQGRQSSSRVGSCTCTFLPSCSSSVMLPFAWIKGSVDFPPGFPTRLSHDAFQQGCPKCHRGGSRSSASKPRHCRESRFLWNEMRHLRASWNGDTTLEFLSHFLWRVPPLEMRWECRKFFPEQAGKGSLMSSCEAETGLLWKRAGPSCFLSSGDGYVGELLDLQLGCEGHFRHSRG